jgi:hypothetical protein
MKSLQSGASSEAFQRLADVSTRKAADTTLIRSFGKFLPHYTT